MWQVSCWEVYGGRGALLEVIQGWGALLPEVVLHLSGTALWITRGCGAPYSSGRSSASHPQVAW